MTSLSPVQAQAKSAEREQRALPSSDAIKQTSPVLSAARHFAASAVPLHGALASPLLDHRAEDLGALHRAGCTVQPSPRRDRTMQPRTRSSVAKSTTAWWQRAWRCARRRRVFASLMCKKSSLALQR
ncbi:hypothetical protein PF008_g15234 [Phytophthora fragariae]|uniref:Uncharacterized protein n=1 Tax=Phytophthora fragariae TaxID=53985 RepID=A0A6G0REQ9_9STRA|nr:hypothetical protein PF008_g15234 [Phytophthora fragariae]